MKFGIGRYLYRLAAQWVDYDVTKKQLTQLPQLPAFALPRATAAPAKPPEPKAEKPAPEPAKAEAPKREAAKASLPANGQELHRRLRDYDARLAGQKLCNVGALLAHVTQAGVKAGFTANMTEWNGPAIPFAVDAVKAFELTLKKADARPAA